MRSPPRRCAWRPSAAAPPPPQMQQAVDRLWHVAQWPRVGRLLGPTHDASGTPPAGLRAHAFRLCPLTGPSATPKPWPAAPMPSIIDLEDAVGTRRPRRCPRWRCAPPGPRWPPPTGRACWCASTPRARPGTPTMWRWWPRWCARAWRAWCCPRPSARVHAGRPGRRLPGRGVAAAGRKRRGRSGAGRAGGCAQVLRLVLGHLDLQLDMGMACGPDQAELAPLRWALVLASRRAGLAAPVDGVTTATGDAAALAQDTARSRRWGFRRQAVHPPGADRHRACHPGASAPPSAPGPSACWRRLQPLRAACACLMAAWWIRPSSPWPARRCSARRWSARRWALAAFDQRQIIAARGGRHRRHQLRMRRFVPRQHPCRGHGLRLAKPVAGVLHQEQFCRHGESPVAR